MRTRSRSSGPKSPSCRTRCSPSCSLRLPPSSCTRFTSTTRWLRKSPGTGHITYHPDGPSCDYDNYTSNAITTTGCCFSTLGGATPTRTRWCWPTAHQLMCTKMAPFLLCGADFPPPPLGGNQSCFHDQTQAPLPCGMRWTHEVFLSHCAHHVSSQEHTVLCTKY